MVWVVLGGGVVVIVLAILLSRARVPHDGVDNFRRQIDALSPEARRPVVGRVNEARQTPRDHGLTVRRVTAVTPANRATDDDKSDVANRPVDESVNKPLNQSGDELSERASDGREFLAETASGSSADQGASSHGNTEHPAARDAEAEIGSAERPSDHNAGDDTDRGAAADGT